MAREKKVPLVYQFVYWTLWWFSEMQTWNVLEGQHLLDIYLLFPRILFLFPRDESPFAHTSLYLLSLHVSAFTWRTRVRWGELCSLSQGPGSWGWTEFSAPRCSACPQACSAAGFPRAPSMLLLYRWDFAGGMCVDGDLGYKTCLNWWWL